MPPTALARPKMLPSTSRRIRTDPPTGICASKSHRKGSMCVSFLPSRTAMAPGVYDSTIMRRLLGAAVTAVRASLIQTLTVGTGISPIQPFAGILPEGGRWRAGRGLSPPVRTYTDPGARMCVVILTQLPGSSGYSLPRRLRSESSWRSSLPDRGGLSGSRPPEACRWPPPDPRRRRRLSPPQRRSLPPLRHARSFPR
jgi:hypothetical protein